MKFLDVYAGVTSVVGLAVVAGAVMVRAGRWWRAVRTGGAVAYAYCLWHTVTTHIISCIVVSILHDWKLECSVEYPCQAVL